MPLSLILAVSVRKSDIGKPLALYQGGSNGNIKTSFDLEAGQGIEYVRDHLGHVNIQNTMVYAEITSPWREKVFAELEKKPEIVKVNSQGERK